MTAMPNVSNDLYAFEGFQLHAAERRLLHGDVRVPLPEKAFDTLCVLVKNSNHLVTRETLLSEVWKETIVEENNLAKSVSLLRKVLRTQADGREFIETVRGHGFRFTADVRVLSAPDREEVAAPQSVVAPRQPGGNEARPWPVRLALAALLATVLLLSYSAMSRTPTGSPITSVAILPFQNAGSEAELAYLSDGLSEDLIDRLSELRPLKVISRYSSFRYRGENINLHQAASELGVGGIITGTFVRRGDLLSISVELTDARSNTHLWGKTYRSTLSDVVGVLEVQRDITRAVSQALRLKLTGEQERRQHREYTPSPWAFELVLRGRSARQKGSLAAHRQAIEYFTKASEADPNYGLAFAELSLSYSIQIGVPDPKEALGKAEAAAVRALHIDDSLAEAHHSLGNIKMNRLDWAGAEDEFTRAIQLNPSLARARAGYANILAVLGDRERALAERQKARELDPLLPRSDTQLAWGLMGVGKVDEAIELFKKSDLHTHENLGFAYGAKRVYREAAAEFEKSIMAEESNSRRQTYLGVAYAKAGDVEKARAILRQLDSGTDYVSPTERAVLLDALGDRDGAFVSLNKAVADRDPQLQNLKIEVFFDDIRSDPRFHELLRRLGLPQ
jgi:TolB-like protein/DNA-binding winged helix-turn-helix (wHTH) protein/Flp pilus assembly protein TadD